MRVAQLNYEKARKEKRCAVSRAKNEITTEVVATRTY